MNTRPLKPCELTNEVRVHSSFVKFPRRRMVAEDSQSPVSGWFMEIIETIAMPGFEEKSGDRRRFVAVQAAKAGVGACLSLGFAILVGRPDFAEAVAIAGLLAPA